MPREKKYTKTIAFRVTAEEWELIVADMTDKGYKKASDWVRGELAEQLHYLRDRREANAKRAEAAAKRAAKKAAANVSA